MALSKTSQLQDFIVKVDDVLPPELCDEIINEYTESEYEQSETFRKKDDYRTCRQVAISDKEVIGNNERRRQIDQTVFEKIDPVVAEYALNFDTHLVYEGDSGYVLLRYEPGQFYKEHTDDPSKIQFRPDGTVLKESLIKRKVTLIIQLNDDFEGGGLSFFGDTHRVEVKKGSAILFPSEYLFPHQALPVTKGVRYSLITWID